MRKIMLLIVCTVSVCGFSQEKLQSFKQVSKTNAFFQFDQFAIRHDQTIAGISEPFRFELKFRTNRTGSSIRYKIVLQENISIFPGLGLEYNYYNERWTAFTNLSFRADLRNAFVRIDFGSNFDAQRFSSSILFNVHGKFVRIGPLYKDDNFGVGTEFSPMIWGHRFRLRVRYVHNDGFGGSLRVPIDDLFQKWFPKEYKQFNDFLDRKNPFIKKSGQ